MNRALVIATLVTLALLSQAISPPARPNSPRPALSTSPGSPGLLYVNPPNVADQPVGSQFNISIQVSGMPYFQGWDVYIQTNSSLITPVNMSISGDLFEVNYTKTPFIVNECINGKIIQVGCGPFASGPGIAEISASFLSSLMLNPPPPLYGLLFNVTYRVVASGGFSPIQVLNATLANGTTTNVALVTEDGSYGTPVPGFTVSANPKSLVVPSGSAAATTINVTSVYQFSGNVSLRVSGLLVPTLQRSSLIIVTGASNTTTLVLEASNTLPSSLYPMTITVTSGGIVRTLILPVNVQSLPFFELQVSPGLLKVHAGLSANTTLFLQGELGFTGNVKLTLQVTTCPQGGACVPVSSDFGIIAQLRSSNVNITSSSTVFTDGLNVTVPVVSLPYKYEVNVTATGSGSSGLLYAAQTLTIVPPPASLSVSFNPSSIVVLAGQSANSTINVVSVDYFWGYMYLSAVMNGGTASFSSNTYFIPLPNSLHVSYTPSVNFTISVSIPLTAIPGNYLVIVTVYSLSSAYQGAVTKQIAIPITIQQLSISHTPPAPITILGLAPILYFAILGVLAVPLVILAVRTYRTREKDDDEDWRR